MQCCERNRWRVMVRDTFRRNPHLIISQYCAVAGLDSDAPLPRGLTVNDMIESILDNEESESSSSGVFRAMAG